MIALNLQPFLGPTFELHEVLGPYWPVLILGFLVSLLATPIARRYAFRFHILDIPDQTVKTHKQPTAYLGGLAILVGFLASMALGAFFILGKDITSEQIKIIGAICSGAILACMIGLIDDIKDIKPWQKLFGQGLCSLFLVLGSIKPNLDPFIQALGWEVSPAIHYAMSAFIVLFFVLGASNSLNLLDGLDGLCTGVTAIITVGFLILALHLATWGTNQVLDPIRIIVSMSLVGAALGFLIFNRYPARIFLGDAGSIVLGFIIASMMLLFSVRQPRWWMASIMIFGLPILDTGTALIRRFLNKRPLFLSDRGHIYDQMIDRGIPLSKTVALNYMLAGFYALIGISGAVFLRIRYAFFVYLAVGIISFVIVGMKGYFKMEGIRGKVKKIDPID